MKYLIIGGNSGIGKESITRLLDEGHELFVASRTAPEHSSPNLNYIGSFDPGSVFDAELPDELDGVVYFPGTINLKPFRSLKKEDFLEDLEVNFFGALEVIKAALKPLKKSRNTSSVVLFSTVAVGQGMPFHSSIAVAKAAIEALSRSLAAEFAPHIRFNVIAPSLTETGLASNLLSTPEKVEASKKRHPLNRIGDPSQTAGLVSFLLGKDSGFMTGQIIGIDGGLSSLKTL